MLQAAFPRIPASELCVILPAHNEAAHLPGLLSQLSRYVERILVVDNGSTDQTAALARAGGAQVLACPGAPGKTAAIRAALPRRIDAAWLLFMDADGQHDPVDIPRLWEARGQGDAVFGVRDLSSPQMPWPRRVTNRAMSWLLNRLLGGSIPDTQCGFRLVRSSVLKNWLPRGSRYEWETELYARLQQVGARILCVPVRVIYRGERSGIFWPRDAWRFFCACLKILGA